MSQTTTVTFKDRGFWARDDAFGLWFAYLIEEIERDAAPDDNWLREQAAEWRVHAAITDLGADVRDGTPEQLASLTRMVAAARLRAKASGDVPVEHMRTWIMVDDLPVAHAFSRTGDRVEVNRIIEVADAFLALLTGALPPDPTKGAWFVGNGNGYEVMPYRKDFPDDAPRFPRIDPK